MSVASCDSLRRLMLSALSRQVGQSAAAAIARALVHVENQTPDWWRNHATNNAPPVVTVLNTWPNSVGGIVHSEMMQPATSANAAPTGSVAICDDQTLTVVSIKLLHASN